MWLLGIQLTCLAIIQSVPFENNTRNKAMLIDLPAELLVDIAGNLDKYDLISLCASSSRLNEICVLVLYRHVDLQFDPHADGLEFNEENSEKWDIVIKRQRHFVETLLSRPKYGIHVRSLKGKLCVSYINDGHSLGRNAVSEKDLWRAMQSLTQVQSVDMALKHFFSNPATVPPRHFPTPLFQTATSVRIVGQMQYGLAKSILEAIDPAKLKSLCLDMVQDRQAGQPLDHFVPGDVGEDGRVIALGATSGLLTNLTGRCTTLQTLVLRRIGQVKEDDGWDTTAEEASYLEWAAFIRSVQGTVEEFTYEQAAHKLHTCPDDTRPASRIMDRRFRHLVLPAIISRIWPCLKIIKLRGVRRRDTLKVMLQTVLGKVPEIELEEEARLLDDYREPNRWN